MSRASLPSAKDSVLPPKPIDLDFLCGGSGEEMKIIGSIDSLPGWALPSDRDEDPSPRP